MSIVEYKERVKWLGMTIRESLIAFAIWDALLEVNTTIRQFPYPKFFSPVLYMCETYWLLQMAKAFEETKDSAGIYQIISAVSDNRNAFGLPVSTSELRRIKRALNKHQSAITVLRKIRNDQIAHNLFAAEKPDNHEAFNVREMECILEELKRAYAVLIKGLDDIEPIELDAVTKAKNSTKSMIEALAENTIGGGYFLKRLPLVRRDIDGDNRH